MSSQTSPNPNRVMYNVQGGPKPKTGSLIRHHADAASHFVRLHTSTGNNLPFSVKCVRMCAVRIDLRASHVPGTTLLCQYFGGDHAYTLHTASHMVRHRGHGCPTETSEHVSQRHW